LTILLVRTFTGGGIDGGGDTQLLYLTLLFGLRDEYRSPKRRVGANPVSPGLVPVSRHGVRG